MVSGDSNVDDVLYEVNSNKTQDFQHSLSLTHVNYSCGTCGYELNLNSCNRNTSLIGAKYEKAIKRGIISFYSIDETRFTQTEQLRWVPYFNSKYSWGLFRRITKLFCSKCGSRIGNTYNKKESIGCRSSSIKPGRQLHAISWDGISGDRVYDIRINALQPSATKEDLNIGL